MKTRIPYCYVSRHGIWYFRKKVPAGICDEYISLKPEIRKSLKTKSVREAVLRSSYIRTKVDVFFEQLMNKDSGEFSDEEIDLLIDQLETEECWVNGVIPGTFASDESVLGTPAKTDDELRESARFRAEVRAHKFEEERQRQRQLAFDKEAARQVEEERGLPYGSLMTEEVKLAPVLVSTAIREYCHSLKIKNPNMGSRETNRFYSPFRYFLALMGDMPLDQLSSGVGSEFYHQMRRSRNDALKLKVSDRNDPCSTHPKDMFLSGDEGNMIRHEGAMGKGRVFEVFVDWAFSHYGLEKRFSLFGSVLPDEKPVNAERSNTKRKALTDEQTRKLLLHPDLFNFRLHEANSQRFWMAAVMAYTGCRNGEVLFLTEAGIAQEETTGIYYFDITGEYDTAGKKIRDVKSPNSVRKIPIHSQLIEWGILDIWAQTQKDKNKTYLFNNRKPGIDDNLSSTVSGYVRDVLKKMGIYESNRVVPYSLRHRFINQISSMGLTEREVQYFVGHIDSKDKSSLSDTTRTYYLKDGSLEEMQKIIQKLPGIK